MNRWRSTGAADEHSLAGRSAHPDIVDTTIDRVLAMPPETTDQEIGRAHV